MSEHPLFSLHTEHVLTTIALHRIGNEIGVDGAVILETSHGRRSIDVLKILAPEKANWECKYIPTPTFPGS